MMTDIKFDQESLDLLLSLMGKTINSVFCENFSHSPRILSYGMAVIDIEGDLYRFTNLVKAIDYFNQCEDVGIFCFERTNKDEVRKFLEGSKLTKTTVNQKITEIRIVNEDQQLYQNGLLMFELQTVRGVVFTLEDGREISFEKDIWFSEMILVSTGHDLINDFAPEADFLEDWDSSIYDPQISRSILKSTIVSPCWEEESVD